MKAVTMTRQRAYGEHARSYDQSTGAYQGFRREILDALPLRPGDVVLDVGCGTGLCFPMIMDRVGPTGGIIGIDASPDMVMMAGDRVEQAGWRNVTLLQSTVEDADIPVLADAAIFCAVHDILRSPEALRNVVGHLRPGAWLAAGGGKWAAPWMPALNLQVMALHGPYVGTFEGFERPWSHLEHLTQDMRVDE
jgi:trans-aconitate methyltransferase